MTNRGITIDKRVYWFLKGCRNFLIMPAELYRACRGNRISYPEFEDTLDSVTSLFRWRYCIRCLKLASCMVLKSNIAMEHVIRFLLFQRDSRYTCQSLNRTALSAVAVTRLRFQAVHQSLVKRESQSWNLFESVERAENEARNFTKVEFRDNAFIHDEI